MVVAAMGEAGLAAEAAALEDLAAADRAVEGLEENGDTGNVE